MWWELEVAIKVPVRKNVYRLSLYTERVEADSAKKARALAPSVFPQFNLEKVRLRARKIKEQS